MAHLYPTLEDMQVDHIIQAQQSLINQANASGRAISAGSPAYPASSAPPPYTAGSPGYAVASAPSPSVLYPQLENYMGLEITPQMIEQHNQQIVPAAPNQVAQRSMYSGSMQIAPITGNNVGIKRAEIKQGVRQITLCKDQDGKIGLRIRAVNNGVFVSFVHDNSPASLAGLRFGDQILQINGENVAGWDNDKTVKFLKKALPERITMAIRDRPFERTITLQKDSAGTVGFVFKDNKITAIVKDSSAARNGVLTEHHMVELNGQNVIGLKEKDIKQIVEGCGRTVTVTIIPSYIYEHIMKNIGSSLIRKHMDHSVPDL